MKRILAMALALCMVLALMPAIAMAEESHAHCACQYAVTGKNEDKCASHNDGQVWQELDPNNLPTSGYYYLTTDLVLSAQWKITGDLHICTNGYDISRATTAAENLFGLIRVDNSKSLTITNCKAQVKNGRLDTTDAAKTSTISGGKSTNTAGALIHLNKDSALNLYGVEIANNETSSSNTSGWGAGAVLACDTGINIDIAYAAFRNNQSTATNGGALTIRGGVTNIRNTVFANNSAELSGAAIYLCNSVTSVNITSCDFTGNSTNSGEGGAALFVGKGAVTLTDVTMTGNENSGRHGSAITQQAGTTLKLNSCNITGNNNTSHDVRAAVVAIGLVTELSVSGNTVISGNTNNSKEQNVFLRDYNGQAKLTVGALTSGAKISMYTANDLEPSAYLIATSETPAFAANNGYLTYENRLDEADKTYGIGYNGTAFSYGVVGHYHAECACAIAGVTCKDHTASEASKVLWTAWDATASENYKTSLPTSGYYYLTDNVTLSADLTLGGNSNPANIHICTNGFDINYSSTTASQPVRLYNGNLAFTNCKAVIKDGQLDTTDAAKTSTISGGKTTGSTAGFFRLDTGTLTLCGVELKNNETFSTHDTWGGGVILTTNANSNLSIAYCAFNENHARTKRGGAISMVAGAADIRNTTFKGNTSETDGSAMLLSGAAATLVDCRLEENVSGSSGAIYLYNGSEAELTNVTMTGNSVLEGGSGGSAITVQTNTPTLTLNSCNITGNTNTNEGMRAAIVVVDDANFTITGNTVVTGNTNRGVERNILLRNWNTQPKLTVGQLTEGANISVEAANREATLAIEDPDTILTKDFTGDYQLGWISYSDGSLVGYDTTEDFYFIGTVTEGDVTYKPWAGEEELPASGNYYLLENVDLAEALSLENATVQLNLNGKTVSGETVATLGEGANLSIVSDGGQLDGKLELAADGATINSDCAIEVEMNGNDATINASNVTLTDKATDNGTVGGKIYGNCDVAARVTENGVIRYLILDGTDSNGAYKTANAVRVKVKRINVRPGKAGLYYTTEVIFNQNVANAGATYGVALSLVDKPDAGFATDGDSMWTAFTAPTGADFNSVGTSCLVNEIMKNGVSDAENANRGEKIIHANAYVQVADQIIMMENVGDVAYSLKTVMQGLDGSLKAYAEGTGELTANAEKALSFYETWEGAMADWNLTYMAAALTKKNAG